jgi:HlyD family secretion protein
LKVKKEQLASSVLLIGMVKAESEQYVYFDNTIGRNASVTVYVGEEISVAQQLIQYDSTSA